MLLVGDHMTREVVTLTPETTAAEALAVCRERRIRHLPVIEDGELVGIVSDRDWRSATPALGEEARSEALARLSAGEVMNRDVVTATPEDPIEVAANVMRERSIGCLPVIEGEELAGILTSSDVMEALVYLVGAHEPGSRLEVAMPDRPGALAGVAGVFGELGVNIVAAATGHTYQSVDDRACWRVVVFRVDTIAPEAAIDLLGRAGYEVLWPSRP